MLSRASARPEDNPILYANTELEYHLGIDPDKLSDEAWAAKLKILAKLKASDG